MGSWMTARTCVLLFAAVLRRAADSSPHKTQSNKEMLLTRATGRRRVGVYIAQTVQLAECSDKASGTDGVVKT